ncbi:MAG: phage portal protein [Firmicutes bacterium]|nr:phage portal protein [Bacillota bacterium]
MEPSDLLLEALLGKTTISRDMALSIPAVSAAVDFISATIASMPIRLYKIENGNVEEQTDDPRVRLLNDETGDTLNAWQMKKAMVADYLLGKGGYAYIQKQRNRVTGLFYVKDTSVGIEINVDPIRKSFTILVNDKRYEPYEFVKLLRNTQDGASGTGLTAEVATVIETAAATIRYQLATAKSGGSKKGFIKANKKLGQDEIDVLKAAWRRLYADGTESVVVLNNGLEFQEASTSSAEMQLNENKRTLSEEIDNIFHLSDDFNQTFKTALMPIIKAFETELNRVLLLEKEKKAMYFTFDSSEVTRATARERYEAYQIAKNTGFMTINEIRRMENLSDIEGMDVINVGLSAVLYDIHTQTYYNPNSGTTGSTTGNAGDSVTDNEEKGGDAVNEADNQI